MKQHFFAINFGKRLICALLITLSIQPLTYAQSGKKIKGRGQWTEKQAWDWEKKHGVIKGFNAPIPAYPGMGRDVIFQKAADLGFNSVRTWLQGRPETHIKLLHEILDQASAKGLTVSPVLEIKYWLKQPDLIKAKADAEAYVRAIIHEFKNDPRIILWDIWNEPELAVREKNRNDYTWLKDAFIWAREEAPIQPITSSSIWLYEPDFNDAKAQAWHDELALMNDVHNFHLYDVSVGRMKAIEEMIARLKKLSNRPIVCTEAIARTRGGTFGRTLSVFSKYHVHFYSWGLYTADTNWDVAWNLSSFRPYEPWFHDLLHPDGSPYDWAELDWIRRFHFAGPDEITDPGAEVTERWSTWRAWKWMAEGPIKGLYYIPHGTGVKDEANWAIDMGKAEANGYNGLRIKLNYNEWRKDSSAFYKKTDTLLALADRHKMRVTPALLSDEDAFNNEADLSKYVSQVVKKYGFDTRVIAWELYTVPGKQNVPKEKLKSILALIFRVTRFEFIDQPLTATPVVKTNDFNTDFNYETSLIHGHRGGWDRLEYEGSSDAELCNYIWSLSDVISFSTNKKMPETGWLLNVVNRYGRPIICTAWTAPDNHSVKETMDLFSKNHVYWYNSGVIADPSLIQSFRFTQISTPRR